MNGVEYELNKVILCPNATRDDGLKVTTTVNEMLRKCKIKTVICPFFEAGDIPLPDRLHYSTIDREMADADMALTFGGDGTILRAARALSETNIPILAINMGTKGFMAPEVLRGEDVTPAADVYALGVVFFYLLTGVWYDKVLVEKDRMDLHLLQYYEYRWRDILPLMLDEDPARRPADLVNLPQVLLTVPSQSRGRPRRWPFAAGIAAALCVAVGAYFLLAPPRSRTATTAADPLQDSAWLDKAFDVAEPTR